MTKPSDYPPVKDLSISALEKLLERLKIEEADKLYDEYWEVERKRDKAIEERGIPEFSETPRPPISYIAKQYYPHKELSERKQWLNGKDYLLLLHEGLWRSGSIPVWICIIALATVG